MKILSRGHHEQQPVRRMFLRRMRRRTFRSKVERSRIPRRPFWLQSWLNGFFSGVQGREGHSHSMSRRLKTCTEREGSRCRACHRDSLEIYRRNTRARLNVEIEARTTTAKDTTEVMAQLMGAIDEATSGATDQRRPLTHILSS